MAGALEDPVLELQWQFDCLQRRLGKRSGSADPLYQSGTHQSTGDGNLCNLGPGPCVATVQGKNAAPGVALVAVYILP